MAVKDRRVLVARCLDGLFAQSVTGNVPPGTKRVEVEVLFDTMGGPNDAYADDISLKLSP